MKKSLPLIALLFVVACSTNPYKTIQQDAEKIAPPDSFLCRWKIENEKILDLMLLEVPYNIEGRVFSNNVDTLSLCVAKYKSQDRPIWISIELPHYIVQNEGLFLYFKRSRLNSDSNVTEDSISMPICVHLEKNSSETITAYMADGFVQDNQQHLMDILQRLLDNDMMYLMFFIPDDSHKTISIPLNNFKKQYKDLEKDTIG